MGDQAAGTFSAKLSGAGTEHLKKRILAPQNCVRETEQSRFIGPIKIQEIACLRMCKTQLGVHYLHNNAISRTTMLRCDSFFVC